MDSLIKNKIMHLLILMVFILSFNSCDLIQRNFENTISDRIKNTLLEKDLCVESDVIFSNVNFDNDISDNPSITEYCLNGTLEITVAGFSVERKILFTGNYFDKDELHFKIGQETDKSKMNRIIDYLTSNNFRSTSYRNGIYEINFNSENQGSLTVNDGDRYNFKYEVSSPTSPQELSDINEDDNDFCNKLHQSTLTQDYIVDIIIENNKYLIKGKMSIDANLSAIEINGNVEMKDDSQTEDVVLNFVAR